ncbi:MAG: HAD family hydrolase [Thiolinea sp.]
MSELKALLFDVDGTLADTERDGHRIAFNKAFAEAGLDWVWSVALYGELLAVTGGKERIRYYIEQYLPDFEPVADLTEFIVQLHQRKTHFYLQLLQGGEIPLRNGVKRLLIAAREAGLRLGIATTTTPENVTGLLSSTLGEDSVHWFEVIAAGDMVAEKKPAPDIYHYAMQVMAVRPEECIAFEDSANGVLSATAAKLTTLVTVNDYTRQHDFSSAALVLDQLGEAGEGFTVLQGEAGEHSQVTVELLRELHSAAG